MSGFIELTLVGVGAPVLINVDHIAYVWQGPIVPGDDGVTICLDNGKEIGVIEVYQRVIMKIRRVLEADFGQKIVRR